MLPFFLNRFYCCFYLKSWKNWWKKYTMRQWHLIPWRENIYVWRQSQCTWIADRKLPNIMPLKELVCFPANYRYNQAEIVTVCSTVFSQYAYGLTPFHQGRCVFMPVWCYSCENSLELDFSSTPHHIHRNGQKGEGLLWQEFGLLRRIYSWFRHLWNLTGFRAVTLSLYSCATVAERKGQSGLFMLPGVFCVYLQFKGDLSTCVTTFSRTRD